LQNNTIILLVKNYYYHFAVVVVVVVVVFNFEERKTRPQIVFTPMPIIKSQ
jgi:tRNA-binding EMAP/Myf-like protein